MYMQIMNRSEKRFFTNKQKKARANFIQGKQHALN